MTILLYLMVIVFGFYSFSTLPLALMPSMEVPAAIVYATYPGAGPEDIEQQVAKPLESAVAGLSGLDTLQSTSSENMAMLIVQFTDSTDLDDAMTDLRDKVSQVKSQLPDDASDPTVMSIDIDSMPVVQVALRGSDLAALQSIAEDEISPALERLDGVASVDVSGGYEDEVAVKTNAARLKGYNLTITSVAQQLGADNMAIPGGDLDNGSQTLAVRTDGEYSSLNDVKNALISLPAGGTVRLSQIADVSMQPKDRSTIAKVDGEECIMLSVNKQSGSNTVKVAQSAVERGHRGKRCASGRRRYGPVRLHQHDRRQRGAEHLDGRAVRSGRPARVPARPRRDAVADHRDAVLHPVYLPYHERVRHHAEHDVARRHYARRRHDRR